MQLCDTSSFCNVTGVGAREHVRSRSQGSEVERRYSPPVQVPQGRPQLTVVAPLLHPPPSSSSSFNNPRSTPLLSPLVRHTSSYSQHQQQYQPRHQLQHRQSRSSSFSRSANAIAGTSSIVAVATTSFGGGGSEFGPQFDQSQFGPPPLDAIQVLGEENVKPLSSAWETALSATTQMNRTRKPPVRRGKIIPG